jgi:hypothetical protein
MKSISRGFAWAAACTLIGLGAFAETPIPAPTQAATETQPAQTAASPKETSKAPITILEDTLLRVWTVDPVDSKHAKHGTPVLFTVSEDVMVDDALAIPRGATVHGIVTQSKKAGRLTGSADLTLELVSLDLGGRNYPLYTYAFKVTGMSKTKPTETKVLRGAGAGAIVGSIVNGVSTKNGVITTDANSRAASMAVGAGLGAGVGTAVAAATPGPRIWIPSESQLDFYLASPVAVTPLSAKDAAKLGEGLFSGGPVLYVRGETP